MADDKDKKIGEVPHLENVTGDEKIPVSADGQPRYIDVGQIREKADKLSKQLTIWGQPFDGSQNIKGDLINVGNIVAKGKLSSNGESSFYNADSFRDPILGRACAIKITGALGQSGGDVYLVTEEGNVGLGLGRNITNGPPTEKLDVNGNIYARKRLIAPNLLETIDTSESTLDVSTLPPIGKVGNIILRYDGIVEGLDKYIQSGSTSQTLAMQENYVIGTPKEVESEEESVTLDFKTINYRDAITFDISSDPYTPANWLRIYVPEDRLAEYQETYPTLKKHFHPITGEDIYAYKDEVDERIEEIKANLPVGGVTWGRIMKKPINFHIIGSFEEGTPSNEKYVWVNGTQYFLDENFDFKLDEGIKYGKDYPLENRIAWFSTYLKDLSLFEGYESISDTYCMFYNCKKLETLNISDWNTKNMTSLSYMFYNCTKLDGLDLSKWETKDVTNMGWLFANCENLDDPNIQGWNIDKVTNMSGLFYGCKKLTKFECQDWNIENVTDISSMFWGCGGMTEFNPSKWDVKKVQKANGLFGWCQNLKSFEAPHWKMNKVESLANMFMYCKAITSIDLSGLDTENVTDMSAVFESCGKLTNLNISGWKVDKVTNMERMFNSCSLLQEIDMSNWNFEKVTNFYNFVTSCNRLTTIIGPVSGISLSLAFAWSPLTADSAMVLINGLKNGVTGQTLTLKSTTYSELTAEQKAIGTSKGWSIVSA